MFYVVLCYPENCVSVPIKKEFKDEIEAKLLVALDSANGEEFQVLDLCGHYFTNFSLLGFYFTEINKVERDDKNDSIPPWAHECDSEMIELVRQEKKLGIELLKLQIEHLREGDGWKGS